MRGFAAGPAMSSRAPCLTEKGNSRLLSDYATVDVLISHSAPQKGMGSRSASDRARSTFEMRQKCPDYVHETKKSYFLEENSYFASGRDCRSVHDDSGELPANCCPSRVKRDPAIVRPAAQRKKGTASRLVTNSEELSGNDDKRPLANEEAAFPEQ